MDTRHIPLTDIPPISSFSSRKEWEAAIWKKLLAQIHNEPSADAVGGTLHILTNPSERHYIVMRAAVMACLKHGMSYRQIGDELWTSPQTISTIKKSVSERELKSYRARPRNKKTYSLERPTARWTHKHYRRTKYGKIRTPQ
jgi:Trp operon repressor